MKAKTTLALLVIILFTLNVISQNIWTGPPLTFAKADGADWTLQANQDRITSNVWLTRKNSSGLFNIVSESSHTKGVSPADTEWAYGTTADIGSITFASWGTTNGDNPPGMVNQDMVLHLITDDIYIDIKYLSWANGGTGGQGGFSYVRSTDQTTGIKDINNQQLSVYPNPSSDFIIVKDLKANTNAEIFDINGKKIQEIYVSESNTINISSLRNGIYFLLMPDHGFSKFIKE